MSDYTDCVVEFQKGEGIEVIDNRPAVPGYKVEKKEEVAANPFPPLSLAGADSSPRRRTRPSSWFWTT